LKALDATLANFIKQSKTPTKEERKKKEIKPTKRSNLSPNQKCKKLKGSQSCLLVNVNAQKFVWLREETHNGRILLRLFGLPSLYPPRDMK
jgi:hypothetical protein